MLDQSDRRLHLLARAASVSTNVTAVSMGVLPDAVKLAFRARPSAIDAASRAFGVDLPQMACRFNTRDNRTAFWLGPDEWMLWATGEQGGDLYAALQTALNGQSCSLVDVSHRSDAFAISGPQAAYVLNHGCPLDFSPAEFPVGMCTRTLIGKASVLLSRVNDDTFHIDVWRSFAPYVWQLLDEARGEFV